MTKQSNLLKQFQVWMETKGYSKFTQSNKPSTIADYKSCPLRICAWESKTPEQVAESISTLLPQYTIGEHSVRGRMKSRAVRCSIRAFNKFLVETQAA